MSKVEVIVEIFEFIDFFLNLSIDIFKILHNSKKIWPIDFFVDSIE